MKKEKVVIYSPFQTLKDLEKEIKKGKSNER